MTKDEVLEATVKKIMERRHAASGMPIFVDSVVLRDILNKTVGPFLCDCPTSADPSSPDNSST